MSSDPSRSSKHSRIEVQEAAHPRTLPPESVLATVQLLLYGERGTKKRRTEKRTEVQQRQAWARPENGMEASHGTVHSRESVNTPSGLKTSRKIPGRFCITKMSGIFPPKCWTFFDQKGNRQMIAEKFANWYNPTYGKNGQKTSGDCMARSHQPR